MKNVIFMGTPDFAVGTLRALLASEYTVQAVFTQPDKPKGRGKAMQMTPVKEVAVEAGIPVYQPKRIRDPENLEILKQYQPDVIVVVAFGQIIPEEILKLAPYGCVNVHGSLLPKYRGAAPIQWAVIDGEKESGVTTMRMDAGVDTGDMLLREVVPLEEKETGGSLFDKLSQAGAGLLIRTLRALEEGTVQPKKQPAESPTPYAAMLTKQMGRIDWNQSAEKIECLIRGLNPWPSAYTCYKGKTLKIWEADVETADIPREKQSLPGTVVCVEKDSFVVQTGKDALRIRSLQLEGKKKVTARDFMLGYEVGCGLRLGQ